MSHTVLENKEKEGGEENLSMSVFIVQRSAFVTSVLVTVFLLKIKLYPIDLLFFFLHALLPCMVSSSVCLSRLMKLDS